MTTHYKTIVDFITFFKDEATCRQYFEKIRFSKGDYCPHCGHAHKNRFADGKRFRCGKCKQDFTIKTGTVFGESKVPLQKWFLAIYHLSVNKKGISSMNLAKQVGVTQKTAWYMDMRIRKALKQSKDEASHGAYYTMIKKPPQAYRATARIDMFASMVEKVPQTEKIPYKSSTV